MSLRSLILVVLLAGTLSPLALAREGIDLPEQDPELLYFTERALPYYPESAFSLTKDRSYQTPSGRYRLVTVERFCSSEFLSGPTTILVDEITRIAWVGVVVQVPPRQGGQSKTSLRSHLEQVLPGMLEQTHRLRVKVQWSSELESGSIIPFSLEINSGYGTYTKDAAVTADGVYLSLGIWLPIDRDPVELRRTLLKGSDAVIWDHVPGGAKVEVIEASDFQCPACKRKWPVIQKTLETYGDSISHGLLSFPLTSIHPWAFRSSCAAWCVAEQDTDQVIGLKELFYSMQQEMSVSEVTPTAHDFLDAQELSREKFDACYLKSASLQGVLSQMALGHRLGINSTPTYFINGWQVQLPEEEWLLPMVKRLIEGKDP